MLLHLGRALQIPTHDQLYHLGFLLGLKIHEIERILHSYDLMMATTKILIEGMRCHPNQAESGKILVRALRKLHRDDLVRHFFQGDWKQKDRHPRNDDEPGGERQLTDYMLIKIAQAVPTLKVFRQLGFRLELHPYTIEGMWSKSRWDLPTASLHMLRHWQSEQNSLTKAYTNLQEPLKELGVHHQVLNNPEDMVPNTSDQVVEENNELSDRMLVKLAKAIPTRIELYELGVLIDVSLSDVERILSENPDDLPMAILEVLQVLCRRLVPPQAHKKLLQALQKMEREDLVQLVIHDDAVDDLVLETEPLRFTERMLKSLARKVSTRFDLYELGILLGFEYTRVKFAELDFPPEEFYSFDPFEEKLIREWSGSFRDLLSVLRKGNRADLVQALEQAQLDDLREETGNMEEAIDGATAEATSDDTENVLDKNQTISHCELSNDMLQKLADTIPTYCHLKRQVSKEEFARLQQSYLHAIGEQLGMPYRLPNDSLRLLEALRVWTQFQFNRAEAYNNMVRALQATRLRGLIKDVLEK